MMNDALYLALPPVFNVSSEGLKPKSVIFSKEEKKVPAHTPVD